MNEMSLNLWYVRLYTTYLFDLCTIVCKYTLYVNMQFWDLEAALDPPLPEWDATGPGMRRWFQGHRPA